jgi:cell division protein FtsZ
VETPAPTFVPAQAAPQPPAKPEVEIETVKQFVVPEATKVPEPPKAENGDGEELLLDSGSMMEQEEEATFIDDAAEVGRGTQGTRSWLTGQDGNSEPVVRRESGGTLFERMSNIARGAAKADMNEEDNKPGTERDPLDIPRFLNRQNNQ